MERNMTMRIYTISLLLAAACGGSPKSGLHKGGDVPPPPSIPKAEVPGTKGTAPKADISKDARNDYAAAVQYFNQNDKAAWNESACRSAADKFTSVVREHPDLVAA